MTLGLKIGRMMREDGTDTPELIAEAKARKDVSDSILESIYHKIMERRTEEKSSRGRKKSEKREKK